MTHLRKMMLEELGRRNYAQTTIDCYLRAVAEFSHSGLGAAASTFWREKAPRIRIQRPRFDPNVPRPMSLRLM